VVKGLPAGWGTCICTVSFDNTPEVHTSWKDLIVAGLYFHNMITIDAITGAHLFVLSGHTEWVCSLTFSLDGTLLVSGDRSGTIKLWDTQTGVVVKTLAGHTGAVNSVSISPDHTMIASGSQDMKICLWDTWTGECCCIIDDHNSVVQSVSFSPTNPQLLISATGDNVVHWWDITGHQIGPTYEGEYVTISSDGTYFALWAYADTAIAIQDSGSGAIVYKLQNPSEHCNCCQFSPDNKSVVVVLGTLSTSGTLPTQPLTLLGPLLDILIVSDPLHFLPPLSHYLMMDESNSGS